jgi:hypothetical protein
MAIQDIDNGATADQVLVACSLGAAALRTQAHRWDRLLANAAVQRVHTDDGLRVSFRADATTIQELRDLVSVENECCAWASWTVTAGDGTADVVVRSSGDGIAVLHGMLTIPE